MLRSLPRAVGAWLLAGLVLLAVPARAEGKLEIVETFAAGNSALVVARYTDPSAGKSNGKVGLIGIGSVTRNSFAFDRGEWQTLIDLCDKAIGTQSVAWKQVGAMTERGTEDVARLTLSAGPGVSFVIASPHAGTVRFVVESADLPRLRKGLIEVRDYLAK